MSRAHIGLAVLLIGALAAGFSFFRKDAIADSHRQARQLVLYYTLSRVRRSRRSPRRQRLRSVNVTSRALRPGIVNAGLNGASSTSDLDAWLIEALDGRRAAAIVVALGTDDALQAATAKASRRTTPRCLTG